MARKNGKPGGFAVTRRDFLKSAGVVSAVTAAATPEIDAQGIAARKRFIYEEFLVLQVALGIATLVLVVPIPLAVAHQTGAIVLLTRLVQGQRATVLQLPAAPRSAEEAAEQKRVETVA